MDWIAWDETLDTGHARMDAEHKELAAFLARPRPSRQTLELLCGRRQA